MPYSLKAVVARAELLTPAPPWAADSRVVELAQGFAMVPFSDALIYRYGPAERPWLYDRHSILFGLPEGLVPELVELSGRGPVAYVEADYHGGDGEQRSAVWDGGRVRLKPEESSRAINDALISLGVEPGEGLDRFDTLGLGRRRRVEDWLVEEAPGGKADPAPAPRPASDPAPPEGGAPARRDSLLGRLREKAPAVFGRRGGRS